MTTTDTTRARIGYGPGPAQRAATVVGVLLVVWGILGFIPGVTRDLSTIKFLGPQSTPMLLGVFQTSVFLNALFIVFGLALLGAARKRATATLGMLGVASVFFVMFVYDLPFGNSTHASNIFPANVPDLALNFCVGLAIVITAAATSKLALIGSRFEPLD